MKGGDSFDHTWGWGMNFTDNGRGATLFHLIFFMGVGHCYKYQELVTAVSLSLGCGALSQV